MTGNTKLYKYLDVNGGLLMLRNHNLQFTNSTRLNDPFDCHPALFDFSNAPEHPNNWPPKELMVKKGVTDTENLRDRAWICSLSKIHDSSLMWSYYNKHEGVCIGLDMDKTRAYISRMMGVIMGCFEMEVQYKDVIEKPDYFKDRQDFFHYQMTTKAKDWEHEQEVRLVCLAPSPRYMVLSPEQSDKDGPIPWEDVRAYLPIGGECFESLYLGVTIEPEKSKKIISEALRCNPAIKIYQMSIDPAAFRLKEELIK